MRYPGLTRIRQEFDAPIIDDIQQAVVSQISQLKLQEKIAPGQSVAVACGSRGVANYACIVRATVEWLKKMGLEPFIVPAMGSHGSSTAEGQTDVLRHSGISEASMGVPIRSSLDVVQVGETEDRVPVFMDAFASRADHVVLVNRIKAHTDFVGEIGSGLLKMLAIGLGKPKGAAICHRAIVSYGHAQTILSFAEELLRSGKILFGVGVIENAYGGTARIETLLAEALVAEESELLKISKRLAARLPFDSVDVLVIDEMGKEISGMGFDTNIVGRVQRSPWSNDSALPTVKRIVVRDLTENSYGNALGVGIADFITQRLADKIDRKALYANALAAQDPECARIPLTLPSDREAIEAAIRSVGMIPTEELKFVRIKNTMQLGEVDLSEGYRAQVRERTDLSVISDSRTLQFDADGNLPPF